jgi:hypothetical protein
MWAFLILVVAIVLLLFIPAFLTIPPPTIQEPLVLTPDTRSITVNPGQTTTANFTVANLNQTVSIPATATATLLFQNSTAVPANYNITLTISGVQTRNSFVASTDGKSVTFLPGGNTLVVHVVATSKAVPGSYVVKVSLSD